MVANDAPRKRRATTTQPLPADWRPEVAPTPVQVTDDDAISAAITRPMVRSASTT